MKRFKNITQYVYFFKSLVQQEREAEMSFHLDEINLLSGRQRESKGRAILNLNGKDAGTGIGGVYLVKFIRGTGLPDNEISNGDVVIISKDMPTGKEEQATVVSKSKRTITVAYKRVPPYVVYGKNLRLDLFSNDITFQRMLDALGQLSLLPPVQSYLLSNIELNKETQAKDRITVHGDFLNSKQLNVIQQGEATNDIFLIHGPPGTGKTTTLSFLIKSLVEQNKKILVTAASNTAVDNILEKIHALNIPATRLGNPMRMDENLLNLSLDVQLQDQPDYQQANSIWNKIQVLRKEQEEYIAASGKNRRGLSDSRIIQLAAAKKSYRGIQNSTLRKMAKWIKIQQDINRMYEEAEALQSKAIEMILDNSAVICSTNSSAGSDLLKDIVFDFVCVDEATQATEPEVLIPLIKGRKWVLAGDHKQLPPTIKSKTSNPLRISLFERFQAELPADRTEMLTLQYRMNKEIMNFPNQEFYGNLLRAHPSVKDHSLTDLPGYAPFPYINPRIETVVQSSNSVTFIPCTEGKEERLADSHSYFNTAEIKLTKEVTDALLSSRLFPEDIGIISPYEQQVSRLKSSLRDYQIEIKSIDGFQGREKEVIVISLVRSNSEGKIGFLQDYRRLNVALTRAKRKLVIIGDPSTLICDPLYRELLQKIHP